MKKNMRKKNSMNENKLARAMYMVENYELLVLFHENSGKQQKHCLKPEPPTKLIHISNFK